MTNREEKRQFRFKKIFGEAYFIGQGRFGEIRMNLFYFFRVAMRIKPRAFLLLCVVLFLGGCQTEKPLLSKEAQALKKEMLQEMDKIIKSLVEPVSKKDWKDIRPILQTFYEEMKQEGKLVPKRIMVMDQNGISRSIYPPIRKARWNFSSYNHIKEAYDNKMNVVFEGFMRGGKLYGFFAPILQNGKIIGGISMGYSAKEIEEKWNISENEFLIINFN
ncbi:MAG: hypothetical protein P8X65_09205 [Syntrophobacterales bacterium]|jgi:sensor histidine kinase regulating citrate/malate metabolism